MLVNWGIIGTGNIAKTFVDEFNYTNGGRILAVASRTQEKASKFAKEYEIERAYQGYETLIKDGDIDVIYVATPHNYHYENTILCLNNNKSVLCEKPIAVNLKQTKKMVNMAKEKGLFLMEAMWTYFLPVINKAREWILQGKIGDIHLLTAQFGFRNEIDFNNRLFDLELAGGALLDVGIYPIALSNLFLKEEPIDIKAAAYINKESKVDEHDSIILKYKNGAIAQLTCSIQAELDDDLFIYGTEGAIHIPDFWKASKVILNNKDGKEYFEDKRNSLGYNYEIDEVNKCISSNKTESEIVTFKDSVSNMDILDQVRGIIGLKYPFEQ